MTRLSSHRQSSNDPTETVNARDSSNLSCPPEKIFRHGSRDLPGASKTSFILRWLSGEKKIGCSPSPWAKNSTRPSRGHDSSAYPEQDTSRSGNDRMWSTRNSSHLLNRNRIPKNPSASKCLSLSWNNSA